jgi:hypothetical protein
MAEEREFQLPSLGDYTKVKDWPGAPRRRQMVGPSNREPAQKFNMYITILGSVYVNFDIMTVQNLLSKSVYTCINGKHLD